MKKINKVEFFQSSLFIKFFKNRLKVFKVRDPVLYLFLLEPRVLFDFILGYIYKNSRVIKIFLEKSLEFSLEQTFIPLPVEVNLPTKKKSGK